MLCTLWLQHVPEPQSTASVEASGALSGFWAYPTPRPAAAPIEGIGPEGRWAGEALDLLFAEVCPSSRGKGEGLDPFGQI